MARIAKGVCVCHFYKNYQFFLKRKFWLLITFNRNKNISEQNAKHQPDMKKQIDAETSSMCTSIFIHFELISFILIFLQLLVCHIFFSWFLFILIPCFSFPPSTISLRTNKQLFIKVPCIVSVISTLLSSDYKPSKTWITIIYQIKMTFIDTKLSTKINKTWLPLGKTGCYVSPGGMEFPQGGIRWNLWWKHSFLFCILGKY